MGDMIDGSIRHYAQAYLPRTTVIGSAMPEPYWFFVLIYLTAGWVGGILTQAVVGEAVDRRAFRRLTEVREALDAEYGRPLPNPAGEIGQHPAEIANAGAQFSPLANGPTRPRQPAESS